MALVGPNGSITRSLDIIGDSAERLSEGNTDAIHPLVQQVSGLTIGTMLGGKLLLALLEKGANLIEGSTSSMIQPLFSAADQGLDVVSKLAGSAVTEGTKGLGGLLEQALKGSGGLIDGVFKGHGLGNVGLDKVKGPPGRGDPPVHT